MRKFYLLLLLISESFGGYAQTIFSNTITGTNPNSFNPYTEGQITDPNITVSGIGRGSGLSASNANNRYNAGGWTTLSFPDVNDYFEFTLIPNTGYAIHLDHFIYSGQASASGPVNFAFRTSIDGYSTDIGVPVAGGSTINLSTPAFQNLTTPVTFRLYGWGGTSSAGTFSINDFSFAGLVSFTSGSTTPNVVISSNLSSFSSVVGQPSMFQSYSVSGSGLTNDINIEVSSGFEISFSNNSGFGSSLVLNQAGGLAGPVLVYARQNSSNPGTINGIISHTSTGSQVQNIAVSGKVLSTEPTLLSALSFSNVTGNAMDIHFSGGNGSSKLVVMRAGLAINGVPLDGTLYTANNNFGMGAILNNEEYIVYNGTGNSVNVTGLSGNTIYFVSVFEFNDSGIPEAANYLAAPATGSQVTGTVPSGVQLNAVNTLVNIDFDQTVNYANQGKFGGNGIAANAIDGQLNSGAWAASGWSDGELLFNETRTTGDYARGFTLSHPSTGGIYAFEPSAPGNRALGIQPGTGDWAPGTITLRLQNQTGYTIHSLGIAYKLFVYNNADRSSSFHFSYSTDNLNYTDLTTLDYISPSTGDVSPAWVQNDRTIEISSLSVLPGQYIYIRWNSADLSGTGSRDEFALDDISMIANPVTGPLPVRFTTLKAIQRPAGIELEFSNATEENLLSYEVERSANGRTFSTIRQMLPSMNDGGRAVYHFLDEMPLKGDNYYRIRSKERNGNVSYSTILRINTQAIQTSMALYPNPVNGTEVCIQLSRLSRGRYQIKIFNAAGRQVLEKAVDHEGGSITQYLTVSQLPPGWYSVRIVGRIPIGAQFFKP